MVNPNSYNGSRSEEQESREDDTPFGESYKESVPPFNPDAAYRRRKEIENRLFEKRLNEYDRKISEQKEREVWKNNLIEQKKKWEEINPSLAEEIDVSSPLEKEIDHDIFSYHGNWYGPTDEYAILHQLDVRRKSLNEKGGNDKGFIEVLKKTNKDSHRFQTPEKFEQTRDNISGVFDEVIKNIKFEHDENPELFPKGERKFMKLFNDVANQSKVQRGEDGEFIQEPLDVVAKRRVRESTIHMMERMTSSSEEHYPSEAEKNEYAWTAEALNMIVNATKEFGASNKLEDRLDDDGIKKFSEKIRHLFEEN